ncbi:MAG: dTMP kinase [Bacteroidetes bacterium]|nr:dTMP kinase [Bacteroidota bacterium]MBU1422107.1 dTMP kinase [Bacteroidota bacterium]
MLISFEGLDFSGKTTQIKLLVDRLKSAGHDTVLVREPGGTPISEKIRNILLDNKNKEMTQIAELFLFSAARNQLVNQVILPSMKDGKIVICDRFYDSTTAYQGYGRGINIEAITKINEIATMRTKPDLTFFIDIPINEITKRRLSANTSIIDRMESSGEKFYEKVRNGYLEIAKNEPERFFVINGLQDVNTIHDTIWKIISKNL